MTIFAKRMKKALLCLIWLCCVSGWAFAQTDSRVVVAGIQYKPIFPIAFLGTGHQSFADQNINYDIFLKSGFNGGMVIRKPLTNLLAIETGINYVKRHYKLAVTDGTHQESSEFRVIGYEIPVSAMVYVQLGQILYMNASLGISPDVFASNVQSFGENHHSVTVKNHLIAPAVLANLGWEVRTVNSGYFYLGASLHRPFNDVFITKVTYKYNGKESVAFESVAGSYLTFDIRYFFPTTAKKQVDR